MKQLLSILSIIILLSSCTNADLNKIGGYGGEFTIEMYSGGQLVRTWTSTGKVQSENNSNGYYFEDKKTGKLVEVDGDIVITKN